MSEFAVLFDFGGTLDSDGISWLGRFYPIYLQQGLQISRDAFARAFYVADERLPIDFSLDGLGLAETLMLQVRCVLEILAPQRLEIAEPIASAFLSQSRGCFAKNRPMLARLAGRYSLAIVSNFYGNLESILAEEALLSYFKVVADSGRIGKLKPDPQIFRHVIESLDAEPQDSWMIGDSLARDMRGAEALGMPHIWLRAEPLPGETCCPRGRIAASLAETEFLIDSPATSLRSS